MYLTVAFIQMLKAFSPTYMIFFLYCLGVEKPSRSVIGCVLGKLNLPLTLTLTLGAARQANPDSTPTTSPNPNPNPNAS